MAHHNNQNRQRDLLILFVFLFIVIRTIIGFLLNVPFVQATSTSCPPYAEAVIQENGVSSSSLALCENNGTIAEVGLERNSVLILDMGLGNAIVDGPGVDFYFYERAESRGILLDHMEISISSTNGEGRCDTFTTVFIWGDEESGNNGTLPDNVPAPEPPNFPFERGILYNGTGIGIDIAPFLRNEVVETVGYRFVCIRPYPSDPQPGNGLRVEIDAIERVDQTVEPAPTDSPPPSSTVTLTPAPLPTSTPTFPVPYPPPGTPSHTPTATPIPPTGTSTRTPITPTETAVARSTSTPTTTATTTSTSTDTPTSTSTPMPTDTPTATSVTPTETSTPTPSQIPTRTSTTLSTITSTDPATVTPNDITTSIRPSTSTPTPTIVSTIPLPIDASTTTPTLTSTAIATASSTPTLTATITHPPTTNTTFVPSHTPTSTATISSVNAPIGTQLSPTDTATNVPDIASPTTTSADLPTPVPSPTPSPKTRSIIDWLAEKLGVDRDLILVIIGALLGEGIIGLIVTEYGARRTARLDTDYEEIVAGRDRELNEQLLSTLRQIQADLEQE